MKRQIQTGYMRSSPESSVAITIQYIFLSPIWKMPKRNTYYINDEKVVQNGLKS